MIYVHRFPLNVLVELIFAHHSLCLDGSPIDRIDGRIQISLELARQAALTHLQVHLTAQDLLWFCEARKIDHSYAIGDPLVLGVPAQNAGFNLPSHVFGRFSDGEEGRMPLIIEPTQNAGYVQRELSDAEKQSFTKELAAAIYLSRLEQFGAPVASKAN